MLVILTILAVAGTDLIGLAHPRLSRQTVRFIQLAWWLVLALAAAFWVRPEGWAGAVAALGAAAWYFIGERRDERLHQQRDTGVIAELYAWSAVSVWSSACGIRLDRHRPARWHGPHRADVVGARSISHPKRQPHHSLRAVTLRARAGC